MPNFWEKCKHCCKPMVCSKNLKKLRWIIGGSVAGSGILGAAALPLIGFGAGGVAAGSTAAAWQSGIGAVTAGSLFATLQSLGATGVGTVMFGSAGAALGLLASVAPLLGWCNGNCLKVEIISKSCGERCSASFELTVNNVKRLESVQSSEFDLRGTACRLKIFKHNSNYLGIGLSGNKSCKKRIEVKIDSKTAGKTIEKEKIQSITVDKDLRIEELILLNDLFDAKNGFIENNNSIKIQVSITDGIFVDTERNKLQSVTKLKCNICSNGIEKQELSSVQCGLWAYLLYKVY